MARHITLAWHIIGAGCLLVADAGNHRLREVQLRPEGAGYDRMQPAGGDHMHGGAVVRTVAGTGVVGDAEGLAGEDAHPAAQGASAEGPVLDDSVQGPVPGVRGGGGVLGGDCEGAAHPGAAGRHMHMPRGSLCHPTAVCRHPRTGHVVLACTNLSPQGG